MRYSTFLSACSCVVIFSSSCSKSENGELGFYVKEYSVRRDYPSVGYNTIFLVGVINKQPVAHEIYENYFFIQDDAGVLKRNLITQEDCYQKLDASIKNKTTRPWLASDGWIGFH